MLESAKEASLALRKRVERTVVVVFITLSCRAIFAVMFAAGFLQFNQSPNCSACGECQSELTVMGVWFIENPAFHVISLFVSAPVALLLALFGALLSKPDLIMLLLNQSQKSDDEVSKHEVTAEPAFSSTSLSSSEARNSLM